MPWLLGGIPLHWKIIKSVHITFSMSGVAQWYSQRTTVLRVSGSILAPFIVELLSRIERALMFTCLLRLESLWLLRRAFFHLTLTPPIFLHKWASLTFLRKTFFIKSTFRRKRPISGHFFSPKNGLDWRPPLESNQRDCLV